MEAIRNRMRRRLQDVGFSQTRLAGEMDREYKNVNRWLSGETDTIPADFVADFVRVVPVNPTWLLTGTGTMDPVPAGEAQQRLEEVKRVLDADVEELRRRIAWAAARQTEQGEALLRELDLLPDEPSQKRG